MSSGKASSRASRTARLAAPQLVDETRREDLKRTCESLWQTWRSSVASDVETLRELIDPHATTRQDGKIAKYGHCPQAKEALDTLISAHSTYITPAGQRWFAIKSRKKTNEHSGRKTSLMDWYTKLTEVMADELSETNFYNVIMEVYHDRCLGGTGCMFIGGNDILPLNFKHIPLGSFSIAEDCYGHVNTLVRREMMTAAKAVEAFGYDALPDVVKADYDDAGRRNSDDNARSYIHLVRPNEREVIQGIERVPYEMRTFEGYYMLEDDYTIIKEEGYFEFPFLVTRFLKSNGSPFGEAPCTAVIPVIRRLKKLERLLDVMAEKAAYPGILQLPSQNRQIDTRAGGITTVSQREAELGYPREWGSSGRYDIGLERIKELVLQIRRACFADMLNAMGMIERPMTATEVNAREAEKVLAFMPSFHLFISDFHPAARRVIAILYRQDKLPKIGADNDLFMRAKDGRTWMLNPKVCFLGKIATAIERVQRRGIEDVLQSIIAYTQATGDMSMLKALKAELAARYILESSGAPADILRNDAELEEIKHLEDEAMEAAEEQQDIMTAAEVVNKAGGAASKMQQGGGKR